MRNCRIVYSQNCIVLQRDVVRSLLFFSLTNFGSWPAVNVIAVAMVATAMTSGQNCSGAPEKARFTAEHARAFVAQCGGYNWDLTSTRPAFDCLSRNSDVTRLPVFLLRLRCRSRGMTSVVDWSECRSAVELQSNGSQMASNRRKSQSNRYRIVELTAA